MPNQNDAEDRARERSIALWNECQAAKRTALDAGADESQAQQAAAEVWNAWADDMLAKRKALEDAGKWDVKSEENSETTKWFKESEANFRGVAFRSRLFPKVNDGRESGKLISPPPETLRADGHDICFRGFRFPGVALFDGARFYGDLRFDVVRFPCKALFRKAQFFSASWFSGAQFVDGMSFEWAKFLGFTCFDDARLFAKASFQKASFSKYASFRGTYFYSDTSFRQTKFKHSVSFYEAHFCKGITFVYASFNNDVLFSKAHFYGNARFNNASSTSHIYFTNSIFDGVPDFTRAELKLVPRVDNMRIEAKTRRSLRHRDKDAAAKFRALKKFAIEQHDYARELDFFAGELKSERFHRHKIWHSVFLFGIAYEVFSNFGRSIWRPLGWWIASTLSFSAIYLSQHMEKVEHYSFGLWQFFWGKISDGLFGASLELSCIDQSARAVPSEEAIYLAVQNGLLAIGGDRSGRIKAAYHSLYGETADIPLIVSYASIFQMLISAVLIFLLLLAVRNHFRIK
ncbi:MAG: pentapeptide repeat-containing protein [Hyphomicrobiales bacterium]|nr:pentapeptide repeat-containing protein [Hyphomicrobiales bacterium]